MKNRTILFAMSLLLAGSVKAQQSLPYSYGFEDYDLSTDGWTKVNPSGKNDSEFAIVGAAKKTGSYGFRFSSYNTNGVNTQYLISPELAAPSGVDVTFEYAASDTRGSETFKVGYSTTDAAVESFTFGDEITTNSTTFQTFEGSFPAGTKYVAVYYYSNYQYRLYVDDFTFAAVSEGPALTVADNGKMVNTGYAYDFGIAAGGTTKEFTLANPGTEDITLSISSTSGFGVSPTSVSIPAKEETTLTVTMPDASASGTVTITPTAAGIDPFVINVSGTIRNADKVFETLLDGSIPEDWTTTGTWSWSTTSGASNTAWYETSNYRLISPLLTVGEGEVFAFEAQGTYSGYQGIVFEYSADGTTWTASGTATALTSDWQTFTISDVPAGKYYIALHGWHVNIRNFYGGELPKVAKMVVTQPESLDFGIITEQTTKTFTIANTGRAALEGISVTATGDAVFSVTGAPSALAAGESAEVTVAMAADAAGVYSTAITVGADGMEPVSFTLTGAVMPEDAFVVSFDDNQLPAGWTAGGSNKWSYADGKAYCTSAAELTSPQLVFAEGDFFIIKATSYDNYDNNYIEVSGSADGSDWTAFETRKFVSRSQIPYGSYGTLVVKDIPTTVKYIKLKGYYVRIDEIAGLTYNQDAPIMSFAAEDFAAGKVAQSTSKTYTVSNSGTGTLTVNIASDDEHFTVSPAQLVITDEPKDFTVTFNYQEGVYGKFSADITVTPTYDETAAVSFAATAQVVDPNLWEEDFEAGTLPTGWVATGWTIGSYASYENTSKMALAPSSSSAGTLTTPCLTAKQGDVLTWDAYLNWYDEALTVEYSADGQQTWTQICTYKAEDDGISTRNSHKAMSFTAPADGDYYLRFTSTYQNGVDNFSGFKLNLPDHILSIAASSIPASSQYYMQMKEGISFNATVTLAESRGVNEEVTVRFYMDDEVIGTATETVEAGSSKAITIVCTPTKPATEGAQMHIEVEYAGGTLTTEPEVRYVAAVVRLDLAEAEETEIATGTTFDVVTLKRTFAEGWNTFVSPLSVSLDELGEGAAAYTFTSYADGVLTFSKVSGPTLNPATPYIVYVPARLEDKTFTWQNVSISSLYVGDDNVRVAKDGVIFQGTYAPVAAPGMEGKYGVTPAAKIAKGTAGASIKGFRAYLELPEGAEVKALAFDGDGATAVEMVNGQWTMVNEIYNLGGQRLGKMQRGINIVNGKKVLK